MPKKPQKLLSKKKIAKKKLLAKKINTKKNLKKKKKILAIPKGYHSLTCYLIVNDGLGAIEFYKNVFGAKEKIHMDMPNGKLAHAELQIGDTKLMLADENPELDALSPRSIGGSPVIIYLYVKNVDAIVEKAKAEGAKIIRPLENMFYGDRSCTIEDPFGHRWDIATHIEDVSLAKLKKRAAQMFCKLD